MKLKARVKIIDVCLDRTEKNVSKMASHTP